jgi:hypothetical protein
MMDGLMFLDLAITDRLYWRDESALAWLMRLKSMGLFGLPSQLMRLCRPLSA